MGEVHDQVCFAEPKFMKGFSIKAKSTALSMTTGGIVRASMIQI
jgi:hypothetical protein